MSWAGVCQPSDHNSNECEENEGASGSVEGFVVSDHAATPDDPGEGALDDPAPRQDGEALAVGILPDDLEDAGVLAQGGAQFVPGVGGVGPHLGDPREAAAQLDDDLGGAVAILDRRRPDAGDEDQPLGVDREMLLDAANLLGAVPARRIARDPPFSAAATLRLSITAAVGSAARPRAPRLRVTSCV